MIRRGLVVLVMLFLSFPTFAAIDAYVFPDDESRDRYHALIDELRCPQCLNTNLAGSDSMIAKDLRREVHRLVLEGYTDEQVLNFMYERYGDFILYEPRVAKGTYVLWFGPLVLLFVAFGIGWRISNKRKQVAELSPEEQAELDHLMESLEEKN